MVASPAKGPMLDGDIGDDDHDDRAMLGRVIVFNWGVPTETTSNWWWLSRLCQLLRAQGREPDSRNPCPLTLSTFWLRYFASVASARFASEIDFCSFAILMASQNESSI